MKKTRLSTGISSLSPPLIRRMPPISETAINIAEIDFDIRSLPSLSPSNNGKKKTHARKAAYLAPYWVAEVRKSIDRIESAGR